jgi:hypothetical protein
MPFVGTLNCPSSCPHITVSVVTYQWVTDDLQAGARTSKSVKKRRQRRAAVKPQTDHNRSIKERFTLRLLSRLLITHLNHFFTTAYQITDLRSPCSIDSLPSSRPLAARNMQTPYATAPASQMDSVPIPSSDAGNR